MNARPKDVTVVDDYQWTTVLSKKRMATFVNSRAVSLSLKKRMFFSDDAVFKRSRKGHILHQMLL